MKTTPTLEAFVTGIAAVSAARKLIFRVPTGEVVSFPADAVISKYGQNNDAPVIVVYNATDNGGTWQGADAENGVIIMNEVPEEVALELLEMVGENLTIDKLNAIIARAVELGCEDNYTTKVVFVDTKLSPAGRMIDAYTGIVKRDERDVCTVVTDGEVIWRKLGDDIKHIELDIFERTYRKPDGSAITVGEVPVIQPEE